MGNEPVRAESRRLWRESRAPWEYRALQRDPVWEGEGVADGEGMPVLLIPGFIADDRYMGPLKLWLRRTGYTPAASRLGWNCSCANRTMTRLERRLDELVDLHGRRVAIVGHSRGGQMARVLAVRRPDAVEGIVTLGMPPLDAAAVHPAVKLGAAGVLALGAARVPGFMRPSCLWGSCCEPFRDDLSAPFPDEVGFKALHSESDAFVDSRRLAERDADPVPVRASHLGMAANRHAFRAIAAALEEFRMAPSAA